LHIVVYANQPIVLPSPLVTYSVGASLDNITRFVGGAINDSPSLTHAIERAAVQPTERAIATVVVDSRCISLLQSHLERSALPAISIGPERTSVYQRLNLEGDAFVDIECLASSPVISLESEDSLLSIVVKVDGERTVGGLFIRAGDLVGLGKSVLQVLVEDVHLLSLGIGDVEPEIFVRFLGDDGLVGRRAATGALAIRGSANIEEAVDSLHELAVNSRGRVIPDVGDIALCCLGRESHSGNSRKDRGTHDDRGLKMKWNCVITERGGRKCLIMPWVYLI